MTKNKQRTLRRLAVVLACALACALVAACDDLVLDPTFKTWCGDALCAWKLDSGQIRRAPTWHAKDLGVELVDPAAGTTTQISQETSSSPRCVAIVMVADVDPAAQVALGLDFGADGTVDFEQSIVANGFHEVKAQLTAPSVYAGIRFTITKRGRGRAVLAQINVKSANDCTAPPLALRDLPLGARCNESTASSCGTGVCCFGSCAECCGVVGGADGGLDTTAAEARACSGGGACVIPSTGHSFAGLLLLVPPAQCDPGKHDRPSGATCMTGSDCASDACEGAVAEARRFDATNGTTSCPAEYPDVGGEGCFFARLRGGRCR